MIELIKPFLVDFKIKLKNPFLRAVIISYAFLKWETLLVLLFSNKSIEDRLLYISTDLNHGWQYVIIALVSAVCYQAGLPYLLTLFIWLTKFAEKYRIKRENEKISEKFEIEKKVTTNELEIARIKSDNKTFRELNEKIFLLKESEEALNADKRELNQVIRDMELEVEDLRKEKKSLEKKLAGSATFITAEAYTKRKKGD